MKILLGIQPTGRLHIWNYFWAIRKGLEMQKENEVNFLVAQYHANFPTLVDRNNFVIELEKLWVPQFRIKKQCPDTLELFYKLAHSTSVAELARLPQYQTKEQSLHMLSYPLLMAADIIISDADGVIVWEDQEPHMHFYREIARRHWYREAITIKSETPRIMSIKDPSKKMSKSLWDEHCIYLDDSEEAISEKIMKAPTTPEGIATLQAIAWLYWISFDASRCMLGKEQLINKIVNFDYRDV